MASFSLILSMDNAAFDETPEAEVARILRRLADDVEATGFVGLTNGSLRDVNGNTVGGWGARLGRDEDDPQGGPAGSREGNE